MTDRVEWSLDCNGVPVRFVLRDGRTFLQVDSSVAELTNQLHRLHGFIDQALKMWRAR